MAIICCLKGNVGVVRLRAGFRPFAFVTDRLHLSLDEIFGGNAPLTSPLWVSLDAREKTKYLTKAIAKFCVHPTVEDGIDETVTHSNQHTRKVNEFDVLEAKNVLREILNEVKDVNGKVTQGKDEDNCSE